MLTCNKCSDSLDAAIGRHAIRSAIQTYGTCEFCGAHGACSGRHSSDAARIYTQYKEYGSSNIGSHPHTKIEKVPDGTNPQSLHVLHTFSARS
jgi:hypothetical protein